MPRSLVILPRHPHQHVFPFAGDSNPGRVCPRFQQGGHRRHGGSSEIQENRFPVQRTARTKVVIGPNGQEIVCSRLQAIDFQRCVRSVNQDLATRKLIAHCIRGLVHRPALDIFRLGQQHHQAVIIAFGHKFTRKRSGQHPGRFQPYRQTDGRLACQREHERVNRILCRATPHRKMDHVSTRVSFPVRNVQGTFAVFQGKNEIQRKHTPRIGKTESPEFDINPAVRIKGNVEGNRTARRSVHGIGKSNILVTDDEAVVQGSIANPRRCFTHPDRSRIAPAIHRQNRLDAHGIIGFRSSDGSASVRSSITINSFIMEIGRGRIGKIDQTISRHGEMGHGRSPEREIETDFLHGNRSAGRNRIGRRVQKHTPDFTSGRPDSKIGPLRRRFRPGLPDLEPVSPYRSLCTKNCRKGGQAEACQKKAQLFHWFWF